MVLVTYCSLDCRLCILALVVTLQLGSATQESANIQLQASFHNSESATNQNSQQQILTNQNVAENKLTNQISPQGSGALPQQKRFLVDTFKKDDVWKTWTTWSACSVSCGHQGHRTRSRTCSHHSSLIPGKKCEGSHTETKSCQIHCPVDGHWTSWGPWSPCSVSCGHTGHKTQSRSCTLPSPAYGGKQCSGSSSLRHTCHPHCPVNGGWSSWSAWSSCSVSCGHDGHQTRHRSCSSPVPAHGGHPCSRNTGESRTCRHACPVNGGWGHWTSFGACSATCCTGSRVRTRLCNKPTPANGGKTCTGSSKDTHSCSNSCKGDAHWSAWIKWSHCSKTCSRGTKSRVRHCENQTVCTGPCAGHATEKTSCDAGPCPVDGSWGHWTTYSACPVTCCSGHMTRTRPCDHPAPSHGGVSCPGNSSESRTCKNSCKGDAAWSDWGHWSRCSVSCAAGTQTRTRSCANMTACTGSCDGSGADKKECNQGPCPEWSPWLLTPCSVTCGTGSSQGMRRCTSGHEEDCRGKAFKTETCVESQCPVDGGWGGWKSWGPCSLTCGDGSRHRQRMCDHPSPAHGGLGCHGNAMETGACHVVDCPHWGDYYEVGSCSVTCDQGFVLLQRNCSTGNNHDCTGSPYDEKACSLPGC